MEFEFAKAIIDSYNEVSELEERNIMYYMHIYNFHKDIGDQLIDTIIMRLTGDKILLHSKLESIINEKDEYLKFLNDFKNEYNTI